MGSWIQMPSNCTFNLALILRRCAQWSQNIRQVCTQWANQVEQTCAQWADHGYSACASWSDHGHRACCTWWPCSWFCDAFYWIANILCDAFYWVANIVCVAFTYIVRVVCVVFTVIIDIFCALWSFITFWLCLSKANGGTMFLLTDGTVLMQECANGYGTRRWWKLTPDNKGSYIHGTWSRVHDSHVGRKYFSSSIFADGRLIVCGGEYSDASGSNQQDESNRCEIYDPVADSWTEINAPANWDEIGDGACTLLSDGTFLLGNAGDNLTTIFNPVTNSWSANIGMNMPSSEESWVLLQDGTVITPICAGHPGSEKFIPGNNPFWLSDMNVPAASDLVENASSEIGPGILLPDGRAFYVGATGATALYSPPAVANQQGTWNAGPNLPMAGTQQQGTKDGPGCLLINGNVLIGIAPVNGGGTSADYLSPTSFYEFDGTNISRTNDPPNSDHAPYVGRMLLLPTGQVMYAREDDSSFYAYSDYGSPEQQWRPVIRNCPAVINVGSNIQVQGLLFNGFSQAVGYGDDSTAATNYPLVRIKNHNTGHIKYCRTSNHTTIDAAGNIVTSMGLATGGQLITTHVSIPLSLEHGQSDLFVVVNGIESQPFNVTIIGRG